jgi:hypothetical protein
MPKIPDNISPLISLGSRPRVNLKSVISPKETPKPPICVKNLKTKRNIAITDTKINKLALSLILLHEYTGIAQTFLVATSIGAREDPNRNDRKNKNRYKLDSKVIVSKLNKENSRMNKINNHATHKTNAGAK